MNFSDDETEVDRMLREMEIDELNLSPESVGGEESPNADVRDNCDTRGRHPKKGATGYCEIWDALATGLTRHYLQWCRK